MNPLFFIIIHYLETKIGLKLEVGFIGGFLMVFKVGLPNKTRWVFWLCTRVSEPCIVA